MTVYKVTYWFCAAIAFACAAIPFGSTELFGYRYIVRIDILCAVAWAAAFVGVLNVGKKLGWRRWWLVVTAPFAFLHVFEYILMFFFWATRGFAP